MPNNKKKKIIIIFFIVIAVIISAIVSLSFLLAQQKKQTITYQNNLTFEESSNEPLKSYQSFNSLLEEQKQNESNLSEKSEWNIQKSKACNVSLFIPKNPPRGEIEEVTDYSWKFEEYDSGMFLFTKTARVILGPKDTQGTGSGYVPGAVEVMCSHNADEYTTETLFNKLQSYLMMDQEAPEETDEFIISIKQYRKTLLWKGKQVYVLRFQGGFSNQNQKYYLLATKNNIYLIRMIVMISDEEVKRTVEEIFQNIEFHE